MAQQCTLTKINAYLIISVIDDTTQASFNSYNTYFSCCMKPIVGKQVGQSLNKSKTPFQFFSFKTKHININIISSQSSLLIIRDTVGE